MTVVTRFDERYIPEPMSGCWLWLGSVNGKGYGRLYSNGKLVLAHRFSYELHVGPIPTGLVMDHLCRNSYCVNPAHLEPVTQRENVLRGESLVAKKARQTHCKAGHEFTKGNLSTFEKSGRACLKCKRARDKRLRMAQGKSLGVANSKKTHCMNGHELSGENLHVLPSGSRRCRTCARQKALAYYHARKGSR